MGNSRGIRGLLCQSMLGLDLKKDTCPIVMSEVLIVKESHFRIIITPRPQPTSLQDSP